MSYSNFSSSDLYLVKEDELDRVAVERCLEGDLDAFGSLIERYQRPVFNTVLHMVGDAEDAREVCQQAFMKAFEHLSSYDREIGRASCRERTLDMGLVVSVMRAA